MSASPLEPASSTRGAAVAMIRAGYAPIPIPRGEKNPGFTGWQTTRLTEADVPGRFADDGNLGIILGAPSKNLHDVDLDCPEALALADDFLPSTMREHGRKSTPRSHRWYIADEPGAVVRFKDPEGEKDTLVELRGDGGQTVAPPSSHPSGEILTWEKDGEPASVSLGELREAVSSLAAACLIARRYPKKDRHDFTNALAGFLLRRGMAAPDVEALLLAVARSIPGAARPEDVRHIEGNVRDTAEKIAAGKKTTGGKTLSAVLSSKTLDKITEWLGLDAFEKTLKAPVPEVEPNGETAIVAHRTDKWREALDQRETRGGGLLTVPNYRNAGIFLEHEDPYAGRLRYDEFSHGVMIGPSPWDDAYTLNAWEWLQEPERMPAISKEAVRDAVSFVAHRHAFHPIRDYLNGLVHDGTPRIETWLIDHAGAADTPYVRAVSSKWLIAAVARVMRPGCQVDSALILESPQGTQKSTAIDVLGSPWNSTLSNAALHDKSAMEQVTKKWIVEMAELSGMSRSEVSTVKDFLSRRNDFFRQAYRRDAVDHPRQCVLVGSTNDAQYLRDETGNRRFWPVRIGRFDVDALVLERDQIWAEATARFLAGETWHLEPELEAAASEEQELRRLSDSWEDVVGVYLEDLAKRADADKWPSVSITEVLRDGLGIPHERHDQASQNRVVRILAASKWTRFRTRLEGGEDGKISKRYRPDTL
jgi:hypothetical protein